MLIRVFEIFCCGILILYGTKTIYAVFKYQKKGSSLEIIPSLPIVYCVLVSVYIYLNLPLLGILAKDSFELLQISSGIPKILNTIGFVTGLTVSSAFLCNFAKSFYMLHELDHGKYYYDSAWEKNLKEIKIVTRIIDFLLRLWIAFLFVWLEISLHDLSKYTNTNANTSDYGDIIQTIAKTGFALYGSFFIWLAFAKHFIMKQSITYWKLRSQIVIIVGGCFNIGYILFISLKPNGHWILAFLFIALIFSSLVLVTITKHSYSLIKWK